MALFKSGLRDVCGNFRGISLLSVVGKMLARILLDRMDKNISPNVISESQCGFRANRCTNDMIFTAKQFQEKCIEQGMDLYHCFVDLSKAFDTVNREAVWVVLGKSVCPAKFVRMARLLHDGMMARVNFGEIGRKPILMLQSCLPYILLQCKITMVFTFTIGVLEKS